MPGEGQHLDAALDNHGRGGKDAQSKASVEMPLYDRAGSNHRRSEGEATKNLKTPSRRKKARSGAAKTSPSSRCQTCKKRGVFSDFLATHSARLCSGLGPRVEADPAPGLRVRRYSKKGCLRIP